MIAAELGGGGAVSPRPLAIAERGIANCLKHLGLRTGEPEIDGQPRRVELRDTNQNLFAPHGGLFEPAFAAGDDAAAGETAGAIYAIDEPERGPTALRFPTDGLILARCQRGLVERGEMLAMVAKDVIN